MGIAEKLCNQANIKKIMAGKGGRNDYRAMRRELEGPMPLRGISAIIGLAMAAAACLGFLNIFKLIKNPQTYALQAYSLAFGVAIFTIEIKDVAQTRKVKELVYTWFPFTTVVGGKGIFMFVAGSLGLGFGRDNIWLAIPGMASMCMGIIYIIMHWTNSSRLNEMYDVSMFLHHNQQ